MRPGEGARGMNPADFKHFARGQDRSLDSYDGVTWLGRWIGNVGQVKDLVNKFLYTIDRDPDLGSCQVGG
jgi:hypothetical protein